MPDRIIEGPPGTDGANAYEIAVALGFRGTPGEWVSSLRGLDGRDGRDGVDGKDGRDGLDGKDGTNGRDGVDGRDGQNGRDGIDGKDASAPVKQPWSGVFERDEQMRTKRLVLTSADGSMAWSATPVYTDAIVEFRAIRVMTRVEVSPVTA